MRHDGVINVINMIIHKFFSRNNQLKYARIADKPAAPLTARRASLKCPSLHNRAELLLHI